MFETLIHLWLGDDLAVSFPRYALLVAGGALAVAALAIITWLAAVAEGLWFRVGAPTCRTIEFVQAIASL